MFFLHSVLVAYFLEGRQVIWRFKLKVTPSQNTEALPVAFGNRGTRQFISGNQGNKSLKFKRIVGQR